MQQATNRTSKARRWIELASAAGRRDRGRHLGLVATCGGLSYQAWGNQVLNHRIHGRRAGRSPRPAPPQAKAAPLPNGALIGRLEIPRLKVRAVVREGAGQDTLDVALGHIPGTALPGQPGNAGIAGHRDTLFRGLRKIEKNDVIEFQTPAGSYNYQVESTSIVKPDDVTVLHASQHPEMTLVTCYPVLLRRFGARPFHREGTPGGSAHGPAPSLARFRDEPRPAGSRRSAGSSWRGRSQDRDTAPPANSPSRPKGRLPGDRKR